MDKIESARTLVLCLQQVRQIHHSQGLYILLSGTVLWDTSAWPGPLVPFACRWASAAVSTSQTQRQPPPRHYVLSRTFLQLLHALNCLMVDPCRGRTWKRRPDHTHTVRTAFTSLTVTTRIVAPSALGTGLPLPCISSDLVIQIHSLY